MKLWFAFALSLALAAIPAVGQTLYTNGPINGTTDGWTINFGFVVSDTFSVNSIEGSAPVTALNFGAWVFPGDTLQTAEVSITSSEFGGTTYTDQIVNFAQSGCSGNQYGYNVCTESSTNFSEVTLSNGAYWLNLQNAVTAAGNPIYWDENSGPSSASENSVGTIPSEAFSLLGTSTGDTSSTGTTPEPNNLMLFGSGILGLVGLLRCRLS